MKRAIPLASCAALLGSVALAEDVPQRNAYYGETHLHTALSLDAYIGGTRLLPSDSLRFAKGEQVVVNGRVKQLDRPLDFAAVSDHAEYLGEMYSAMNPTAPGYDNEDLQALRGLETLEDKQSWFFKYVVANNRGDNPQHPAFYQGPETTQSGWQVVIDAAETHNDPGNFTALIAFEWTAVPGGGNMHRNVIFRDNIVPELPFDSYQSNLVEELWAWLQLIEDQGSTALAIPHNSNASKQQMFPETDSYGNALTEEWASTRQKWEPLIEMMQIKGNSEVHEAFWQADEFANFENADSIQKNSNRYFHKRDFVREGLKIGVALEQSLGTNPYKLGFMGGTDSHNGLPADVIESDFIGGHGAEDGTIERRRTSGVGGWIDGVDLSIGSIGGVWAEENTRAAIWDAMKRKETFTTSGTRIKLRMFGGSGLTATDDPALMVSEGYRLGVPMGGDLTGLDGAPRFSVYAEKDPLGANLDRIQIIKGWVDEAGEIHEEIFDVAWSDERSKNAAGNLDPVGNTVNLETAEYSNDIGAAVLIGTWTDAAFDPAQSAFYYARALEIPTPRWSTYDAVRAGLPLLPEVPATIQERAWGSPIWYEPQG